jgi:hypothetical protein
MTKAVIFQSWDETPHLSAEAKDALLQSYSPHERDARTKGIPQLGSGAIYPVPESEIVCKPFDVPAYWPRGYGMDVGWNRTAAVWGAHDRDSDIVYLYSEYYRAHAEPSVHADAIRARGEWIPGFIDPASRGRGQKDGEQLLMNYIDLGLRLMIAQNGVEAGLMEVLQRLSSGRLKIFETLQNYLTEYRLYRRNEKGLVVKERDHLMDSKRYLIVTGIGNMALDPQYLERMGHRNRGVIHEYDPLEAA